MRYEVANGLTPSLGMRYGKIRLMQDMNRYASFILQVVRLFMWEDHQFKHCCF
jgi:hypothetical protein